MKCEGCGNGAAYKLRIKDGSETCDNCGDFPSAYVPDVYFREPYVDPHLIDYRRPEQRNGVLIESRRQKAELMRRLRVVELGDRRGGARLNDRIAQRLEAEKGHVPFSK